MVKNYFFLKNYVTSEEAFSPNVLYYQQLSIVHYQVSFYANNYFKNIWHFGIILQLLAGHGTFVSIVSNRAIHLNAALTFWKQNPGSLISYLIRTGDDSLTVDVLPILTMR